jgi:hypothetical protein
LLIPARAALCLTAPLHRGLVQMMAERPSPLAVDTGAGRWKYPLPCPFARRGRILLCQPSGQRHAHEAACEVGCMQATHGDEMPLQRILGDARQGHRAVAHALRLAHGELVALEVHVLDAQS